MSEDEIRAALFVGFELEGQFKIPVPVTITRKGTFSHDGSVHNTDIRAQHSQWNWSVYNEYKSKPMVIAKMLFLLDQFTPENYASDDSCGLHVHVSTGLTEAENSTELWSYRKRLHRLLHDWEFIQALQQPRHWCVHTRKRLAGSRYCKPYDDKLVLRRYYRNSDKYRSMNFHRQGTVEFRHLSACEHRMDNVIYLFNFITSYLGRSQVAIPSRKIMVGIPSRRVNVPTITINGDTILPSSTTKPKGLDMNDYIQRLMIS